MRLIGRQPETHNVKLEFVTYRFNEIHPATIFSYLSSPVIIRIPIPGKMVAPGNVRKDLLYLYTSDKST